MRGHATGSLLALLLCPLAACPDCEPAIADAGATDAAAHDVFAVDANGVDATAGDAAGRDTIASDVSGTDRAATDQGAPTDAASDAGSVDQQAADAAATDALASDAWVPTPAIAAQPVDCRFGAIGVGATGYCEIAVVNTGSRPLTLGAIAISDDGGGVFALVAAPASGTLLHAAEARTVRLTATPTVASNQPVRGTLDVASDDPVQPVLSVGLQVRGNDGPTAVARVKSINGSAIGGISATPLHLLPLDDVVLTAADSVPGSGRTIAGYLWQIIQQPVGSTIVFSTPDAVETGFTFNSSTLTRAGLDVVGSYNVVLTVTDDQGTTSSNNARLMLVVSPTAGLLVQLTWDHPSADLDLHLIRAGGSAFSSDDCHYLNCKSGMNLDWGGGDQDPLLWLDDIDGHGPELIRVLAPAATSYRMAVHYYAPFSASVDATARVSVYADGGLIAEASRLLTQCNELWEVGDLVWPALTFTSVDTVRQDTHGLCP